MSATALYRESDVIDLHIDSFIWTRVFGYRLDKRHGRGLLGARVFSQVDLPRIREAGVTGGVWSITTNPLRRTNKAQTFATNRERLLGIFASMPADVQFCRNIADYRRAKAQGLHAAFLAVQGGNALDEDGALEVAARDGALLRVTLVHLYTSSLGVTSAPTRAKATGLSEKGKRFVEQCNASRVFVDLAHIHRDGFFDALDVHDKHLPVMVSHTGVTGVTPHWRNLDDEQLRAVAATGGVVGVMYQSSFLGGAFFGGRAVEVINHLEHIINVAGEDTAALGSDWDGAILPPRDMPTCLELPVLVQHMLERRWNETRIKKVLGRNFLRVLEALRG